MQLHVFLFTETAISVQTVYFVDENNDKQRFTENRRSKGESGALVEQSHPSPINYTLEQGTYITFR